MEMCMLTTTDNPYDPFTQYEAWYRFDEDNGYHSCAFLARIARTSDQLSDKENQEEIERAINDIIKYDPQRIANAQVKAKVQANNVTDKDEISKIRRAAISDARVSTGASGKGTRITISDGEWEAIQAGAISDTTLKEILRYSDPDVVRERATPRASTQLSEARVNRIKAMANSGSTNSEIADALGISPSVVSKYLNE